MWSQASSHLPPATAPERHPPPPYINVTSSLGEPVGADHHVAQGTCSEFWLGKATGVLGAEVSQQDKGLLLLIQYRRKATAEGIQEEELASLWFFFRGA